MFETTRKRLATARNGTEAALRHLRHGGLDALRELVVRTVYGVRSVTEPDPVLAADWDVLVVLDACRADTFRTVVGQGEFSGIPTGETRTSPASSSEEWLASVFTDASDAELADLAYVTGNPYSSSLDASRFATVDAVWEYAWDDELGTIPPEPITDRAIETWRDGRADRMVVHYMQPHFPSIVDDDGVGVPLAAFGDRSLSVWEDLRFGRREVAETRASYRANLAAVLESVELLLENLDADRVVLTADHGNAFGEQHVYGHPGGVDLPVLRRVPWSVTSGRDTGDREPDTPADPSDGVDQSIVEDRLSSLGYRS